MASGAESPRQKMINLMYLVFIAMLALNMSKEVLTTFGEIEKSVSISNSNLKATIDKNISDLKKDAENNPAAYDQQYKTIGGIYELGKELNDLIDVIKPDIQMIGDKHDRDFDGNKDELVEDWEVMDAAKVYDEIFFQGGGRKAAGDSLFNLVERFRDESIALLDLDSTSIANKNQLQELKDFINEKYSTSKVKNRSGKELDWLEYNFKGFPEIAATTKLTLMQENTLNLVSRLFSAVKGEELIGLKDAYIAIPVDVNIFFTGEQLTGTIAIGQENKKQTPSKVIINDTEYPGSVMVDGKIDLSNLEPKIPVGPSGERDLDMKILIQRANKTDTIKFTHTYAVNPREANISNPDLNIIYKKIANDLKISMAGANAEDLIVSTPQNTIKRTSTAGLYRITGENGGARQGKDGKVNITVRVKDRNISSIVPFTVVELPAPDAYIGKKANNKEIKMKAQNIVATRLTASYDDPKLKAAITGLKVTSFKVKVGNRPYSVRGDKITGPARSAVLKAKGKTIQILEITTNSTNVRTGYAKNSIPITVL